MENKNKKTSRYCCSNPNCHKVFSKPKIIKYYVCPSCQTLIDTNVSVQPILRQKHALGIDQRQIRRIKSKQVEKKEPITLEPAPIQLEPNTEPTIPEQPMTNENPETAPFNQENPEPKEPTLMQRLEAMVTETPEETEKEPITLEPTSVQPETNNEPTISEKPLVNEYPETAPSTEENPEPKEPTLMQRLEAMVTETPEETEKEPITLDPTPIQPETNIEPTIPEQPTVNENPETALPNVENSEPKEPTLMQRLEAMVTETPEEKEPDNVSSDFKCSYYFGYLYEREKGKSIPETCFECPKSLECLMSESTNSKESVKEIKKWYSFKH